MRWTIVAMEEDELLTDNYLKLGALLVDMDEVEEVTILLLLPSSKHVNDVMAAGE